MLQIDPHFYSEGAASLAKAVECRYSGSIPALFEIARRTRRLGEVRLSSEWTPLRWPCGPLDLEQANDIPAVKEALTAWLDPKALSFLDGGPVNAILVSWAGGTSADIAQQAALQPVIAEAKRKNVAVLGRVTGNAPGAARTASAAGLAALVTDSVLPPVGGIQIIPAVTPQQAASAAAPLLALSKASWPRIPMQWRTRTGERSAGAEAGGGRTGPPWVDANGWACALTAAKAPGRKFWVLAEPPEDVIGYRPASYALAVADSAVYGGEWLLAFDAGTRTALASGGATEFWKAATDAVRFFAARKDWLQHPEMARLGIVSDFDGPNEFIAEEVLNLACRRVLPYRVVDLPKLKPASLAGLKAVLWIGEKAPAGAAKTALANFVNEGGTIIVPASASELVSGKPTGNYESRFDLYTAGKGKIALATRPWSDPWVLASDAHSLLGRKYDMVRTFNAGSCNVRLTGSGNKGYAHVLTYTARSSGYQATVYVAHPFRTARLSTLEGVIDQPVEMKPKGEGVEVYLPPFNAYAAVEFGA